MLDEKTLQDIHDQVARDVERAWNNPYAPVELTYCSRCTGPLSEKMKTRCITDMLKFEFLCPSCWAKDREAKIIKEVEEMRKPKLDVEDFKRL